MNNLKTNLPDIRIGYVANSRTAGLLKSVPYINQVFIYDRDEYHSLYQKSKIQFMKKFLHDLKAIKKEGYDLVFDLSLNPYAGLLMGLIGIRYRIGFNYKNRTPFLTKRVPLEGYEGRHVIEYYLDLLRALGLKVTSNHWELPLDRQDVEWVKNFLTQHRIDQKDLVIGLFPGGGASWGKEAHLKRWPADRFSQLADKIIENFACSLILLGDKNERKLCEEVASLMNHKASVACGQLTLGQLAAMLSQCSLAIMNDGGPLHLAVAVGTKTVSIFGPVDEEVYGPYPLGSHSVVTHPIACRPCYRQFRRASCEHISCLSQLKVEGVFDKVRKIIEMTTLKT